MMEPESTNDKMEESRMETKDYEWDIRGDGATEVPAYVPTRHEITELVKNWYGRILHDYWYYFNTGVASSSGMRLKRYADFRIDLAERAIGVEAVEEAVKEAWEELREKINDERLWNIFRHGTKEQWDEVQEENLR